MIAPDPYAVLGVPASASATEIKAAYRALVKRHHPDAGGDERSILALNAAWEVLGDAERRRRHDAQHRPASPRSPEGAAAAPAPAAAKATEQELHGWLKQVAAPIDRLLGQVINGFPAQLRSGNAGFNNAFQPLGSPNTGLEAFTDQCLGNNLGNGCSDGVNINRLFYKFPIGDSFTATLGAKVRQDDMLAMWPSAYPTDSVLDIFTYAGARGAYFLNLGAGLGLSWAKGGWSISANYVSFDSTSSDSTEGFGEDLTATAQIGYAGSNWGAAVAYTYTDFSNTFPVTDGYNNFGVSGYWSPVEASWFPSISAGFGFSADGNPFAAADEDAWSWMVGLQWADAFMKGNALGMAIGSAGQTAIGIPTGGIWTDQPGAQETIAYELWYKFQVTDNISVTPAFFWVQNDVAGLEDNFGGLIKTTFKF